VAVLGLFVVVTNCSDQHRFKDMAKIFKGLCMSGLWGCFDEFNRIELEVLSVVAMQVEAIMQGRKQNAKTFAFPGEPSPIKLVQSVGYFITMNPGYAGRQALPENLKVLFRGVSMMVPNRETIMKVKLASAGYSSMDLLGKKFNILYALCEQQLSKQRHYDFGLRNILSVLRQSGSVKRAEPPDVDEEMLFMRTVRDMNLSKLVADDVMLFLALLKDLFPKVSDPPKKTYPELEETATRLIDTMKLVQKDDWMLKIIQLYETSRVRHGFMLVGPTLCGKSQIMKVLTTAMSEAQPPNPHRMVTMNPKAITDSQMYGVKDATDEWTPGVFSTIWQQKNQRQLKYTTWIICDGPIDAIWIENLNTVLDDNKILTLANNDRIPMTDNCRIVFEVEDLRNASPATVSRAGIIYVSESDLGWEPFVENWFLQRLDMGAARQLEVDVLQPVFKEWLSTPPPDGGHATNFFDWNRRNLNKVMQVNDSTLVVNVLNLLSASLQPHVDNNDSPTEGACRRLLAYAVAWGIGGLLEPADRLRLHEKLMAVFRRGGHSDAIPPCAEDETIFEYVPSWQDRARKWQIWAPPDWKAPKRLIFSNLLIPTMDSVRAEYMVDIIANLEPSVIPPNFRSVLVVGAPGTAKTSTVMMYLQKFSVDTMLAKVVNFSSATTPLGLQRTIEGEVERKTGKTFCPPGGKRLTVFVDDICMPLVNKWGDQVTNELTRQLVETSGFFFLDRDKRGEFKRIEDLQYVAAMGHPGGGRNDVPNRLKSKFLLINMTVPSQVSVDNIYGSILKARFNAKQGASTEVIALTKKLNAVTIALWTRVQKSLPPTPSRFHYVFNMRELSRVFQGIMETPLQVIKGEEALVSLWKHECTRVFGDKLARQVDKDLLDRAIMENAVDHFGEVLAVKVQPSSAQSWWCDFQRDAEETGDDTGEMEVPKIYEPVKSWDSVRKKAYQYLTQFNEKYPSKCMNLVLFDDAMMHLMRINRTIQQRRGSAMLVGVGGSGKQSLTRLAAFISRHVMFQITISKTYNDISFLDDLRELYIKAGQKNEQVTFVFTDAEIKHEGFLEYMNSLLATGEVVGLLQKEDKDAACAEVRNDFVKAHPGSDEGMLKLYSFFLDRVRDNLHIVLCFSPLHPRFAVRAQMFLSVFSAVNINWFLPWPGEALIAVSASFLGDFHIDTSAEERIILYKIMGNFHGTVRDVCSMYLSRMRKHAYVTPKTFLCLIEFYQKLYSTKYDEVNSLEKSVNLGLQKLAEAREYLEEMKIEITKQEKTLQAEEDKTNKLLVKVQSQKAKAEKKADEVRGQKRECEAKAAMIAQDKEEANRELNQALPFLHEANAACNSIREKDIVELKTQKSPVDVVRLTMDGILLLRSLRILDVRPEDKLINKITAPFIHDSFDEIARAVISDTGFIRDIKYFAEFERDTINAETCELLEPYLRYNVDPAKSWCPWRGHCVLDQGLARKASVAAEGLCKFVGAMVMYYEASIIVKPKIQLLKVQEAKLDKAKAELDASEAEMQRVNADVAELDQQLQEAIEKKNGLEANARAMKKKMEAANRLLQGLSGENDRWTEDAKNFATRRLRLVGDVLLASGFITYCGPFNAEFRDKLNFDCFLGDVHKKKLPASAKVDLVKFLVDEGTVGEWSLEGLPSDDLSIQNGIMVTTSTRYPLMVDPQGQALSWIKSREADRIKQDTFSCVTNLQNKMLKVNI
jgi:dynein heavy chain